MSFEIDLGGRRALVTGAGQHIGRAIALALARAGAVVDVNDIVAPKAEQVAREIEAAGGKAAPCVFDVTDAQAVARAVGASAPEILVNSVGDTGAGNAPGAPPGIDIRHFVDTEPAAWHRGLGVCLFGVLHCTHAALPGMIERGWGRVITITSDAGRVGEPRMAIYGAAKAAAAGFSRSLAVEVGRQGITVNCVSLGMVESEHPKPEEFEQRRAKLTRPYPAGRLGRPTDPAAMVTFLASDQGEWITGQTYPVNGGYSSAL